MYCAAGYSADPEKLSTMRAKWNYARTGEGNTTNATSTRPIQGIMNEFRFGEFNIASPLTAWARQTTALWKTIVPPRLFP